MLWSTMFQLMVNNFTSKWHHMGKFEIPYSRILALCVTENIFKRKNQLLRHPQMEFILMKVFSQLVMQL